MCFPFFFLSFLDDRTTEKEKKKSNEKIIGEMEDLHYKSQGLGSLISVDNYVYYIQRKQVSYPSVSNYLAESVKSIYSGVTALRLCK